MIQGLHNTHLFQKSVAVKLKSMVKRQCRSEIYPHTKMDDIQVYCNERHLRLDQYIDEVEDSDFDSYMNQIFKQMLKTVNTGLKRRVYYLEA